MDHKDDEPLPAAPEETPKPPDRRHRRLPRWFAYALAFVTAVFAALVVTFFTVDLGPYVKAEAEKQVAAESLLDEGVALEGEETEAETDEVEAEAEQA